MGTWSKITLGAAVIAAMSVSVDSVRAADHDDPPARVEFGDAADIGELYAWTSGDTLSVVVTFAGGVEPAPNQTGTWNRDVLYGIHIDHDGDGTADHDIYVRFGENPEAQWGMQVLGFPGADGPLVGPVQTANEGAGGLFWAGLHEDPSFFDLNGLAVTLNRIGDGDGPAEDIAFTGADYFAGLNTTAIVLDIPLDAALSGSSTASIWATTAAAGDDT